MKDYFGNEIHIGDTILFSGRNSRGYRASFDECVVTKFKGNAGNARVEVKYDIQR